MTRYFKLLMTSIFTIGAVCWGRPFWTEKSTFIEGDRVYFVGIASRAISVEAGRKAALEAAKKELKSSTNISEIKGLFLNTQMTFEEKAKDGYVVYRLVWVSREEIETLKAKQVENEARRDFEKEKKSLARMEERTQVNEVTVHQVNVYNQQAQASGNSPNEYKQALLLLQARDFGAAVSQLHSLSRKGFSPASTTLGILYLEGTVVEKDTAQGVTLLTAAAKMGELNAQYHLGEYFLGANNTKDGLKWLDKSANLGHAESMVALGDHFFSLGDSKEISKKAGLLYLKAAKLGNLDAQNKLGLMLPGQKGIDWLIQAANKGHLLARYNLGLKYLRGNGVKKDLSRAKYHLEICELQEELCAAKLREPAFTSANSRPDFEDIPPPNEDIFVTP